MVERASIIHRVAPAADGGQQLIAACRMNTIITADLAGLLFIVAGDSRPRCRDQGNRCP
jgi:hypothetical protein